MILTKIPEKGDKDSKDKSITEDRYRQAVHYKDHQLTAQGCGDVIKMVLLLSGDMCWATLTICGETVLMSSLFVSSCNNTTLHHMVQFKLLAFSKLCTIEYIFIPL